MKSISFKTKNPKALSTWFSKFTSVSSDMILEVDTINETLSTKVYTVNKDVVKISSIKFEELELVSSEKNEKIVIDAGILGIAKLAKKINLCDGEVNINIQYENGVFENYIIPQTTKQVTVDFGVNIQIYNKEIKLMTQCGTLTLFRKLGDQVVKNIYSVENSFEFLLTPHQISRIITLSSLESANERSIKFFIEFDKEANTNVLKVGNRNFAYIIAEDVKEYTDDVIIDLNLMSKIDAETYQCEFNSGKIVLKSLDTDTIIALSSLSV